jgi:hypothetical protein
LGPVGYNSGMEHDMDSKVLESLVSRLLETGPEELAKRSGAALRTGKDGTRKLEIAYFKRRVAVSFPGFGITENNSGVVAAHLRALFLFYLATADCSAPANRWVALSDLPSGEFYNAAYRGYSGNRIVSVFGNDMEALERAAQRAGGTPEPIGDLGFRFQALPRVPLCLVYWRGDEEFSPSCRVLFDGSASHYLPTDLCAFLGSALTELLIEKKGG